MVFKSINVFLMLAIVIVTSAHSGRADRKYLKIGEQTFIRENGKTTEKLKLQIKISDWRVDCGKSRAVIWGQTKNFTPLGVVPYAKVYVIDLDRMRILSTYTTTRGPYDAEFSSRGFKILIDETLIDFKSGKIIENYDAKDLEFEREDCPEFQGRRLLR